MNPKALHDGTVVDSYSEEWRHECEAATMLRLPILKRKAGLQRVEEKRGIPARQQLQDTMMALWIKREAERLADMDIFAREDRMLVLARDNREHIIARIQQAVAVVEARRAMDAANDNNETERVAS